MMRHDSGQWKTSLVTRSHHLRVSNSILFVWYNIYIVSVWCFFGVSSHFFSIHSPHFYLQTGSLHSPFTILDRWSIHTSLDRSGTIHITRQASISSTIITLDLSFHRSEDCRLVEWAQMTYKNIHHVFPTWTDINSNQKPINTRPDLCSINLIFIMASHPLPSSPTRVRWQYQIRYTLFNWPWYEVSYFVGGHYQ